MEGGAKLSVAEMSAGRERLRAGHPTTWRQGEEKAAHTETLAQQMPNKIQHRFPDGCEISGVLACTADHVLEEEGQRNPNI